MFDELNGIAKAHEEYMADLRKKGEGILKTAFNEIFSKYPNVESVRFKAYRPYFNDGDACLYSVHEPEVKFKVVASEDPAEDSSTEEDDYDDDYEDGYRDRWSLRESHKDLHDDLVLFHQCLSKIDDAIEQAVGEDALVTATPIGVEITQYEHD